MPQIQFSALIQFSLPSLTAARSVTHTHTIAPSWFSASSALLQRWLAPTNDTTSLVIKFCFRFLFCSLHSRSLHYVGEHCCFTTARIVVLVEVQYPAKNQKFFFPPVKQLFGWSFTFSVLIHVFYKYEYRSSIVYTIVFVCMYFVCKRSVLTRLSANDRRCIAATTIHNAAPRQQLHLLSIVCLVGSLLRADRAMPAGDHFQFRLWSIWLVAMRSSRSQWGMTIHTQRQANSLLYTYVCEYIRIYFWLRASIAIRSRRSSFDAFDRHHTAPYDGAVLCMHINCRLKLLLLLAVGGGGGGSAGWTPQLACLLFPL